MKDDITFSAQTEDSFSTLLQECINPMKNDNELLSNKTRKIHDANYDTILIVEVAKQQDHMNPDQK